MYTSTPPDPGNLPRAGLRLGAAWLLASAVMLQACGGGDDDAASATRAVPQGTGPGTSVSATAEDRAPTLLSSGVAPPAAPTREADPQPAGNRASILAPPAAAPADQAAPNCGPCNFTGQKTSTVSITARSYIAPVGNNVGTFGNPIRQANGAALASATDIAFSELPSSFPGRFTTHMQVAITCGGAGGNSVLSARQLSLVRHDGTEPAKPNPNFPAFLNPQGMTTRATLQFDTTRAQAWFSSKGRPPNLSEPIFQLVKPRVGKDIWHEALAEWECRCGEPRLRRYDNGYSYFPSHVFFATDAFSPVPNGYSRVVAQGPFSNLWDLHTLGVELVAGTTSLQPFAVPAAGLVRLSASTTGPGKVTSPAPLNCGASCQADVPRCSTQTLTAVPNLGAFLKAWGGSCQGNAAQCALLMDRSKNVTATFADAFRLYVNVVGGGGVHSTPAGITNCTGTCDAPFEKNSLVTLNALPGYGWVFDRWTGDCASAGTSATCVVSMSAARNVTATFRNTILASRVTVNVTGTGTVSSSPAGITKCTSSCAASFPTTAAIALTATPAAGSSLIGWTGDCTPSAANRNVCTVPAGRPTSNVSASFGPANPPQPPRPVF
jgi:hypothetical protein